MKRSLTPAVTTLEDRLALSTTSPSIVVQPPQITGSVDTLSPLPTDGNLQWLAASNAPVIVTMPSGTGQTVHFLTVVTNEPFDARDPAMISTTSVVYLPQQMSFFSVSQLT